MLKYVILIPPPSAQHSYSVYHWATRSLGYLTCSGTSGTSSPKSPVGCFFIVSQCISSILMLTNKLMAFAFVSVVCVSAFVSLTPYLCFFFVTVSIFHDITYLILKCIPCAGTGRLFAGDLDITARTLHRVAVSVLSLSLSLSLSLCLRLCHCICLCVSLCLLPSDLMAFFC